MEFIPFALNKIKIFKNNFLHASFVFAVHIIAVGLIQRKTVNIKPIFTFHLSLLAVYMYRFISLVGIEEEAPTHDKKYCGH
jgi:hypothetical protein